jgi:hypothetical protein
MLRGRMAALVFAAMRFRRLAELGKKLAPRQRQA